MPEKRITTKDIARLANVSRGTVDRVIHGRGKVSEGARTKVEKVLKDINYQPNVIAQTLRANRKLKIALLIPSPDEDPYWMAALAGINLERDKVAQFEIDIRHFYFNQDDVSNFATLSDEVLSDRPDGLLVVPFFYKESVAFLDKCTSLKIPYITFNTHLDTAQSLCAIGQDLCQSGRVAANLIHRLRRKEWSLLIFHFDEDISNALHMQEKERGFREYFDEKEIRDVYTINLKSTDNIDEILSEFSSENVSGVFVTTSKSYKIADKIKSKFDDCILVGYDLLRENVNHLKSGNIDFLINQNLEIQARQGINYLIDSLLFKRQLPQKEFLPIAIVSRENIDSYLLMNESYPIQ